MSPTATASDRLARRRRFWAPRWLVVTHRYLGVALGGLMLLWCLSGAVMLFVPYPSVPEAERAARLSPIDWRRCCAVGSAAAPEAGVRAASVEAMAGTTVLRLTLADGARRIIDLATGQPIDRITREQALAVAAAWGRPAGIAPVAFDQWTVGELKRTGPFWRVRLAGPAATDLYVSRTSGEVVQQTTAASRALNWMGAVPHWLYPTLLRQNAKLWTQVVIWTSLAGTFLTLCGLYLGALAWGRARTSSAPAPRLSPFRGLMAWHHLTGLAAGVLTLTWVASGLVSMNPWGFLEGGAHDATAAVAGPAPTVQQVAAALGAARARAPATTQVRLAALDGRVFLMTDDRRLDSSGAEAPLSAADLMAAGARLGPVADQGPIRREDAYYFAHHRPVILPAWRVRLADGRRVYLDPRSAAVLADVDRSAQGFRWLHAAPHRLDFVPGARDGAAWAAMALALLAAVTGGVAIGAWLGVRRILHDLARLRGAARPT